MSATKGFDLKLGGYDVEDANGAFHCEYVTPSMRVLLNLPQRFVYVCGR